MKPALRAVEIVEQDLKPSDILTRKAFENAIVANSAIGGSTNAPIHINAIARHVGVKLSIEDWEKIGYDVPLLVNMQPAGEYLGEEYYRAGGLPAVMHELLKAKRIHADALTINGKTMGENVKRAQSTNADVIKPYRSPMKKKAGFKVLKGNLFDSAIMKTSVISDEFRKRYLSNRKDKDAFEGRAVVFDGPEDYHHRIDDPSLKIDEHTLLFIRGAGPIGYPGSAEVVNMQPPAALIKKGITSLPCIGDGRQSGTSGSPSILNASPEAAANGGLALLKTGDRVRIDLRKGTADILISKAELARRRAALQKRGGFRYPASQTPWQEIQRGMVDQLADGMVLKPAVKYQRVAQNGVAARQPLRGIVSVSNRLKGKLALVTAAGQGIGRAIAEAFIAEGAKVIATDVAIDKLDGLKAAKTAKLDVLSSDAVDAFAASIDKEFGALNVLANVAGYVHQGTVLECSEKDWDFSFDLNVKSMHRTIKAFLPAMLKNGGGSIINMSSGVSSIKGLPNRYAYGATKAAVIGLTKAVAADFITKGIRCNAICPGTIVSPSFEERVQAVAKQTGTPLEQVRKNFIARQPMARLGTAEEVAALAVFLASDESSYITGQPHLVDGGMAL